ncbi:IS3 family transposase [Streptantibioticus ferralitis]|uniref:IS3 family transposase n=1 Tax=Streptantibioticus ferralitis TaxID=236510 RepID=UPI003382677E
MRDESWFYKHRNRRPTGREVRRQALAEAVKETFTKSGGTYGSPKIWITLIRQGWRVSVNTVAKLMAELGLVARKVRRRSGLTRPGKRPAAPDFVKRDFTAERTDLVWCGDMTQIETGEGQLYGHGHRPVLPPSARLCDGRPSRRWPGRVASDRASTAPPARRSTASSRSNTSTGTLSPPAPKPGSGSPPGSPTSTTRGRLHSVCGFKSPIDYEHDHRASLTEELAA